MTAEDRDLDRVRSLMMAALDDEASDAERAELDTLLDRRPELRQEWDRLRHTKEVTTAMTLKQPPPEVWDTYWTSVYRRIERGFAWVLISLGAIVLLIWFGWQAVQPLLLPADKPGPIRLAVLALIVGGAILVVSVIRERWFMRRRDRYSKEIVR